MAEGVERRYSLTDAVETFGPEDDPRVRLSDYKLLADAYEAVIRDFATYRNQERQRIQEALLAEIHKRRNEQKHRIGMSSRDTELRAMHGATILQNLADFVAALDTLHPSGEQVEEDWPGLTIARVKVGKNYFFAVKHKPENELDIEVHRYVPATDTSKEGRHGDV